MAGRLPQIAAACAVCVPAIGELVADSAVAQAAPGALVADGAAADGKGIWVVRWPQPQLSFGAEGYRWPENELYVVNITVIDDLPGGGVFLHTNPGANPVLAVNNLWVGNGRLPAHGSAELHNSTTLPAAARRCAGARCTRAPCSRRRPPIAEPRPREAPRRAAVS